jgi:hypothetical protein
MVVTFYQTLGLNDIHAIKRDLGVELDPKDCRQGCTTDIPAKAYEALSSRYKNLFETKEQTAFRKEREAARKPADEVKAVAKKPEITGAK